MQLEWRAETIIRTSTDRRRTTGVAPRLEVKQWLYGASGAVWRWQTSRRITISEAIWKVGEVEINWEDEQKSLSN